MIRFERKSTEKSKLAVECLRNAKKSDSGYNKEEVNAALVEMFHGKCYICENKGVTSYQIEHLHPHKSDLDLKYDWNNLFWSCAHCNNIKNSLYDPILDCSKVEVDRVIAFRKEGYFGIEEKLVFTPLDKKEETQNTVNLLYDAYNGTTFQKKIEAKNIQKSLRKQLSSFKNYVRDYEEAEGDDKEDLLCTIKKEVSARSEFAAFKRWVLWDNKDRFGTLIELCNLN